MNQCPQCGYTKEDAGIYADHYLCENSGNAPWDKPHRVKRERKKGFKMPPNTIYVGRGSKWGNPYRIGEHIGGRHTPGMVADADEVVREFRQHIRRNHLEAEITQLRGKNLACWCALDKPCHADVLLEIANARITNDPNGKV